jgi:AcrR family transcriptional regulator
LPKVTKAYTEARRTQILKTASRVYAEKGFRETQMREIAERAGLSTGALYRYFASKEELFRAIIESQRPAEVAFRKRVVGEGSPSKRLDELATLYVRLAESSEERGPQHFRDYGEAATIPFLGDMLSDLVRVTTDDMEALVSEAQASGDIDPELDPLMTGLALASLVVAVDFGRLFERRFDGEGLKKALEAMISGLRPQ